MLSQIYTKKALCHKFYLYLKQTSNVLVSAAKNIEENSMFLACLFVHLPVVCMKIGSSFEYC